jgi:TolB-like protein
MKATLRLSRLPVLLTAVVLLSAAQALAQDARLAHAVSVYNTADYRQSIGLFSQIAADVNADRGDRRQALEYLGRSYVAERDYEGARVAINDLLRLEPPLLELDPDIEPPPLMNLYYEVRRDLTGYEVQRQDGKLRTLAILDFTNTSVDSKEQYDPLQQGFASMMINFLNGATDLRVVERERIQWMLDELQLQKDPALIDQGSAVRMGRLLGASAALFGAFTVHRRQMWISARLVSVETGEILLAEQIRGRQDDFFELLERLSLQVARAINASVEETTLGGRDDTRSLDAMLSYSQGLAMLEQADYRQAYEKFMEALSFDPAYARARRKAESIKMMLG